MPVLTDALTFVAACLAVGLGLFLANESLRHLRGLHAFSLARDAVAARDVAIVVAGLLLAGAAGGYWISQAIH